MKKFYIALLVFAGLVFRAQTICNASGNLMLFTNYDGGTLTINVDQNIPNLKIGICSYEGVAVYLTGAFVNNVTGLSYAGFNSSNNHCGSSINTNFNGVPGTATTSIIVAPTATVSNPNGYSSIICGYSCSNNTNQGGCNTVDQVEGYFLGYFAGSTLFAHKVQYGCWTGTQSVSIGGTCCPPPTTLTPGLIAGTQTVCEGTLPSTLLSITAASGGSGPVTYTWQSSTTSALSGFSDILGTNAIAYNSPALTTTTYFRRAASTSATNTAYSNVITVSVNPLPSVFVTAIDPSSCAGLTNTLVAQSLGSGSFTCVWQPGNLTGNPLIITTVNSMMYTVTATDQNNCSVTAFANLVVHPLPAITINAGTNPVCSNKETSLTANGTLSYTWLPGGLNTWSISITPTASVIYTLTGFDSFCTNTATIALVVNPAPSVTISASKSKLCVGEAVVLTASGGTAYAWLNPEISVTLNTVNVTPTITTSYSVVVTGTNNCTETGVKIITVTSCTGIEKNLPVAEDGLWLYPNPNNGTFTLRTEKNAELEIINSIGQVIRTINLNEKNDHKMLITDLTEGVYFVGDVQNKNGSKRKIIVTR